MKKTVMAVAAIALCAVSASAHNLHYMATGSAAVDFDTADSTLNKLGTAASFVSQYEFQTDGTFRPTGSGASCTVNVTLVATNGTLTVDLSGFSFSGATKTLVLAGGAYCGAHGKLVVTGADAVKVGSSAFPAVSIPSVDLNGATLEVAGNVALFALPPKTSQGWTLSKTATVYVQGDNALADETVDGALDWTDHSGDLHLGAADPVPSGVTLKIGNGRTLTSYPSYPYYKVTEAGHDFFDWSSRGGKSGYAVNCDIELAAGTKLSVQVRNQTFNGTIRGAGDMVLECYRQTASSPTVFNGPVDVTGAVGVSLATWITGSDTKACYVFNDVAFTNGNALAFAQSATNVTMTFNGDVGPRFTTAAFPNWRESRRENPQLVLASGMTAGLACVTAGGAVFSGAGTILAGTVTSDAARFEADAGTTVVKDTSVAGQLFAEAHEGYTTYRGGTGSVKLSDHRGETLNMLGGDVIVSSNDQATVNIVGDGLVSFTTEGAAWPKGASLLLWVSGDTPNTVSNLYIVEGTKVGNTEELAEVGYTTNTSYGTYWVSEWMDRRGTGYEGCRLVNERLGAGGANPRFYNNIYLQARTDERTSQLYVSANSENDKYNRLLFKNGGESYITPRTVVMVFGSQNGGGAAMFAADRGENKNLFGRTKGLKNPMMSAKTAKVWLDGAEVDPTVQTFNGGWQVVSVQPNDYYRFSGIGYGAGYSGSTTDAGGQNYAEILFFQDVLSDAQRKEVERHLARKWKVATYVDDEKPTVAVSGAGTMQVTGELSVDATSFDGDCVMQGDSGVAFSVATNVVVSGTGTVTALAQVGVPRAFDPSFSGLLRLGFDAPLAFDVDNRLTSALNAIHAEPASIDVGGATNVCVRQVGVGFETPVDLVTGGGFVGTPAWNLSVHEGFARRVRLLTDDPCALRLKISCKGTVLLIR